jgi:hypothetical protein
VSLDSIFNSVHAVGDVAFLAIVASVERAVVAEDLFGELGGAATTPERLAALATAFRRIARAVHPDRQPESRAAQAHAAFVKATALRDAAEVAIRARTYGDRRPAPSSAPQVITTRTRTYRVDRLIARGDLCDLYACSYVTRGTQERGLFKIVSRPGDSDLLENEANVLGRLFPSARAEEKFLRYLPRFVDAFVLKDDDEGTERRVVVLPHFDEHVSLTEVMEAYPDGLDFRDVVWMFKRLLVVLGFVHRRGLVHGAIVPPHLLVHPVDHGARLIDWCYSVPTGERVRALSVAHRDVYAPEITSKQPATAQTDIYMAARCALALMGSTPVPSALRRFFETCLTTSPARRPDDAWKLHDELEELLRRLVGPPSYRKLAMPTHAT